MRISGADRHDQGIDGKGRLALLAEPLRVVPHGVASVPMLNDRGRNRHGPRSREGQGIQICAGAWFAFAPPAPLGAWTEASLALLFNLERWRRGWHRRHLIPAPRDARRVVAGFRRFAGRTDDAFFLAGWDHWPVRILFWNSFAVMGLAK